MLPRSCLRLADSKSNSSTRFPRTTTTRVSSGWVASMSILLAIDVTHGGASARARLPPKRRSEDAKGRTELWVETQHRLRGARRTRMRGPAAAHSNLMGHARHGSGDLKMKRQRQGPAEPVVVLRRRSLAHRPGGR